LLLRDPCSSLSPLTAAEQPIARPHVELLGQS
jgi:hypothetical protein